MEFRDGLPRRRAALTDDDVQLAVTFTEPVYSYLLALNPDGQTQLCLPASDDQPQTDPSRELRFPEDADAAFGLTDGAGQQAFLVVASPSPLPPSDTGGRVRIGSLGPIRNWSAIGSIAVASCSVPFSDRPLRFFVTDVWQMPLSQPIRGLRESEAEIINRTIRDSAILSQPVPSSGQTP